MHSFDSSLTHSLRALLTKYRPTTAVGAPQLTARVDGITDADTASDLEPRIETDYDTRGENKVMVWRWITHAIENDRDAGQTRASTTINF